MSFYDYFQEVLSEQIQQFSYYSVGFSTDKQYTQIITYLQTVDQVSLYAQQNCKFLNAGFKTSFTLLQ